MAINSVTSAESDGSDVNVPNSTRAGFSNVRMRLLIGVQYQVLLRYHLWPIRHMSNRLRMICAIVTTVSTPGGGHLSAKLLFARSVGIGYGNSFSNVRVADFGRVHAANAIDYNALYR